MSCEQTTNITKATVTHKCEPDIMLVPEPEPTCECPSPATSNKKHHEGILHKIKNVFTGGHNPAKKAEKYAKKAGKEVERERELAVDAEHYADKAAHKASKYVDKAEKKLAQKNEACERAEEYAAKFRSEAAQLSTCAQANLKDPAQDLKFAGKKMDFMDEFA